MPDIDVGVILRRIVDALVLLDREGRITYTNDAFCTMVGRPGQDLRGLRWSDLLDCREIREDDGAQHLRHALEAHRWNASRTARDLGISRTTLWRRMRKFGLLDRA